MKITEEYFRKCKQREVRLAEDYYSDGEIRDMRRTKQVDVLHMIRVEDIERIEVVVNEFGWLDTMAYMKDDTGLYKGIYVEI